MSRLEHLRHVHGRLETALTETQQTYYATRAHIARNGDLPCTELGPIERALVETRRAIECVESELRIAARQEPEQAPVKNSLTTEQPEDGPAAWLADYGDGSDPEAYVGERPPGVAAECSMTPLYPESVKAERDALREWALELEADAKRYRWLREECKNPSGGLTIASVTEWGLEGWSGDDPDNRIDAAMREGKS